MSGENGLRLSLVSVFGGVAFLTAVAVGPLLESGAAKATGMGVADGAGGNRASKKVRAGVRALTRNAMPLGDTIEGISRANLEIRVNHRFGTGGATCVKGRGQVATVRGETAYSPICNIYKGGKKFKLKPRKPIAASERAISWSLK